jgi:hypothetical protein
MRPVIVPALAPTADGEAGQNAIAGTTIYSSSRAGCSDPHQASARSSTSTYLFGSTSAAACPRWPRLITSMPRPNRFM